MSQVTIDIAGRSFDVVCQEGEEDFLISAAGMLDEEARKLDTSSSRIPESRMLLMAGLLLADRTAAMEEQLANQPAGQPQEAKSNNQSSLEFDARQRASDVEVVTLQGRVAELEQKLSDVSAEASQQVGNALQERDASLQVLEKMVSKIESLAEG